MAEGSDDPLPAMAGRKDPSKYRRREAKERFAVAKYYGLGSDGEWSVEEIAESLDCHENTVYTYLNESQIAQETKEVLAVTEAEWRLDMAVSLRREIQRLEGIEKELLQAETTVATDHEVKTVQGTPTGDRNIRLADQANEYRLKLPVPTDYETITDYSADLEKVQKRKADLWDQLAKILGLEDTNTRDVDETLVGQADEVKIVEYRETDDPYPESRQVDLSEGSAEVAQDINERAEERVDSDVQDPSDGPED